jgi:hypothetical protein
MTHIHPKDFLAAANACLSFLDSYDTVLTFNFADPEAFPVDKSRSSKAYITEMVVPILRSAGALCERFMPVLNATCFTVWDKMQAFAKVAEQSLGERRYSILFHFQDSLRNDVPEYLYGEHANQTAASLADKIDNIKKSVSEEEFPMQLHTFMEIHKSKLKELSRLTLPDVIMHCISIVDHLLSEERVDSYMLTQILYELGRLVCEGYVACVKAALKRNKYVLEHVLKDLLSRMSHTANVGLKPEFVGVLYNLRFRSYDIIESAVMNVLRLVPIILRNFTDDVFLNIIQAAVENKILRERDTFIGPALLPSEGGKRYRRRTSRASSASVSRKRRSRRPRSFRKSRTTSTSSLKRRSQRKHSRRL